MVASALTQNARSPAVSPAEHRRLRRRQVAALAAPPVTERMATGARIDWARLAADLGYTDQAHLSRDFTAIAGETPTRYAQRYPHPGEGTLHRHRAVNGPA